MSERRTSDRKLPELKDLVIALRDLLECHALGLQLGLPEPKLALIDKHPVENHLRMMLSEWLQYDTEATWEKLATALSKIGKNSIAADIRREYLGASNDTYLSTNVKLASSQLPPSLAAPASEEEKKETKEKQVGPSANTQMEQDATKRLAMAEIVLRKIRSQFSLLVINVRSAMQRNKVDALDVHQFLVTYFEGECDIPEVPDFTKIFNAMTTTKLWRYNHHGALEELAESFLPEDDPVRAQVTEYKSQLTGFYATTKIIDFVKLNELEDREEIPGRIFSPKKYNSHYQKLTVGLRLDRDVSELTLGYVDKLWKALAKEFHLPSLTAVMDKIVEGSLEITWLILPHIIEKIRATFFKSLEFVQQHNIIRIQLYDVLTIYDEETMVTGSTPLFQASFAGNIDEVKNLLEGRAYVNEINDNDRNSTPLMGACLTGQADIAKLLLEHKAIVDHQTEDGWSARYAASLLFIAIMLGHTATVTVLLEYGAQVNLSVEDDLTPLMAACLYGSAATVRVLLDHGANVDQCSKDGQSTLMLACFAGQKETVAVLLEYRAQVNLVADGGGTALAHAIGCGYADIARLLLENGATMDFKDDVWKGALHEASEQDFSEVVAVVLEYGAPVNLIVNEEEGNTALCVACENGRAETARVLLNHGATLDYQNKKGQSAVHLACVGGHTETLKVLIEKEPQLNLQDLDGWTPLLYAAKQGHLETIKLLLEHGAAVDIESKSGLTALKVAQSEARQDVCDILLQYTQQGAKVIHPEQEESESRQEEETKAELAKEQRESDARGENAKVEYQQQGADDDSQRLPAEDTQQKRRESEKEKDGGTNRQQQETELTEVQKAEVRSVGERVWEQIKRVLLRERVEKELAAQMRREQGTSELILEPAKERRSFLNRLVARIGQRTPRRGRRPVVGTAPVPERNY